MTGPVLAFVSNPDNSRYIRQDKITLGIYSTIGAVKDIGNTTIAALKNGYIAEIQQPIWTGPARR